MNTPSPSISSPQEFRGALHTRRLAAALLAYASAVSATVGAAAALVGAGIPFDLLVAVA